MFAGILHYENNNVQFMKVVSVKPLKTPPGENIATNEGSDPAPAPMRRTVIGAK